MKKALKFVKRKTENKDLKITSYDEIYEADLIELYDTFLNKIKNTIYHVRLSAQEDTLTKKRGLFCGLSTENQCVVLSEILHMFQCQSGAANLKLIQGPGSAGLIKISNTIDKFDQFYIINQSPTGIYEQEIDLKKL